ncbi:MAG: hypothetical protein WBC44_22220 [Planctomycetaceae bacterium]
MDKAAGCFRRERYLLVHRSSIEGNVESDQRVRDKLPIDEFNGLDEKIHNLPRRDRQRLTSTGRHRPLGRLGRAMGEERPSGQRRAAAVIPAVLDAAPSAFERPAAG